MLLSNHLCRQLSVDLVGLQLGVPPGLESQLGLIQPLELLGRCRMRPRHLIKHLI
jgi:hypothetical protein